MGRSQKKGDGEAGFKVTLGGETHTVLEGDPVRLAEHAFMVGAKDECLRVVDMIVRWEALVPPTPLDYQRVGTRVSEWEMAVAAALALAYRRGYGDALDHTRLAVENGRHREDPNAQVQAGCHPTVEEVPGG